MHPCVCRDGAALTINIAGVVKDWMLIGLSVYLFNAAVSQLNLLGYGLSFVAVAWYNYQKIQVMHHPGKSMLGLIIAPQ